MLNLHESPEHASTRRLCQQLSKEWFTDLTFGIMVVCVVPGKSSSGPKNSRVRIDLHLSPMGQSELLVSITRNLCHNDSERVKLTHNPGYNPIFFNQFSGQPDLENSQVPWNPESRSILTGSF